jgi:hypothetical protein
MQPRQRAKRGDRLIAAHLVVFAFLFLALCLTAAGTARFALALGYSEAVGYAVGVVLELGKWVLPILVMRLWHARARGLACLIGTAWLGLVTYSALATHGTVSSAIASRVRMGTQHMETRSGVKSELGRVEKQLDALSVPQPPRPVPTVRRALEAEKVPPGIWRDSKECQSIRDSTHFQKACNKIVQLRGELDAAKDYERLSSRADSLRETLKAAPVVATSDPLSEAFDATIGRRLPIEGRAGVAVLITIVVEIMSSFGLAALRVLKNASASEENAARHRAPAASNVPPNPRRPRTGKLPPTKRGEAIASKLPARSPKGNARRRAGAVSSSNGAARPHEPRPGSALAAVTVLGTTSSLAQEEAKARPVAAREVPARGRRPRKTKLPAGDEVGAAAARKLSPWSQRTWASAFTAGGARRRPSRSASRRSSVPGRHSSCTVALPHRAFRRSTVAGGPCGGTCEVFAFIRERLERAEGASVSAAELRSACQSWWLAHGHEPLSGHRLGAALRELGFEKWKSNGRIRYRDLRLRA